MAFKIHVTQNSDGMPYYKALMQMLEQIYIIKGGKKQNVLIFSVLFMVIMHLIPNFVKYKY